MKPKPLVSVIIPVYNVAPYLREALDSVLHQTYRNLEIIVIDDGSTDGSSEICDEYAKNDSRIHVIHQPNRGLSAARNVGIDLATGEIIAFLDSDDVYDIDFIDKMLNALLDTGSDLVACKYRFFGTKKFKDHLLIKPGTYNRIFALRALVDGRLNWSMWNKIYRRELWDEVRFPVGHVYEDVATAYKLLKKCRLIAVIDESLYFYRDRQGSITHTLSKENVRDLIRGYSHFLSFVERNASELFCADQLINLRRSYLNMTMASYIKFPMDDKFREKLRRKIIRIGQQMEINQFGVQTKIAYTMLCICPVLLKVVYGVYMPTRMLAYRVIGR